MASAIYPSAKKAFLDGDIDLLSDTVKAALVDTGVYSYSAAHDFFNDITGVVGTPQTLAGKSTTGGIFDADDVVFGSVSGNSVEAVVLYKDTGVAGTSQLIAFIDGFTPVTPNSGSITIEWDNGSDRIFAL